MEEQPEKSGQAIFDTKRGKSALKRIEAPNIELPEGGGAVKGIDETFSVNAVNGTASFSIPLPVSSARGLTPDLVLSYNSGAGNSVFGLGWSLELGTIKRKTGQELPNYLDAKDSDTFLFSGAEDLVPEFQKGPGGGFTLDVDGNYTIRERDAGDFTIRFYRPRVEDTFSRIERWMHKASGETKWRVTTRENVTTLLGWSEASRLADPANPRKVYEWLPEFVFDDMGNCTRYLYKVEDDAGIDHTAPHNANRIQNGTLAYTNRYLQKVLYGNKTPYHTFDDPFPAASDYLFETVFDYGEYDPKAPYDAIQDWTYRPDAFSDYKPGFEIRTTRLCRRVLLFHHFKQLPDGSALVKSLDFLYDTGTEQGFTFLQSVTSRGYIKHSDGTYTDKQLPPLEFTYQPHAWSPEVKILSAEDAVHAPAGLGQASYLFTDLYNEGLSGILNEQTGAWYYKRNKGNGQFERSRQVTSKPALSGVGETLQLLDLDADGGKQLVSLAKQPKGYYELTDDQSWRSLRTFENLPNILFDDQNTRMIDLTGDGRPDLLITEDCIFTWYESVGRRGYTMAKNTPKPFDEEAGPTVVFADDKQTIFLADMSGDGLTDIVRIRDSSVCYWPNLGYGRFGAKITMDQPPVFDAPDAFNPANLRLADLDGSGTTDIIYLSHHTSTCWRNLSGNAFASEPFTIDPFPEVHELADVMVTDFLGTGTMCLVWSSALSKDASAPLRYIDLMGSRKPHLMTGYQNNFGKEVKMTYTPSTKFYLDDEKVGRPWVTKLHFPVQCISRTETIDHLSGHRFVSGYRYHHGYYDHPEREFRGFGMVEQTDAEHFEHWVKGGASNVVEQELHQEPVITKQWFHTGAFLGRDRILTQFADDYWYAEMERQGFTVSHNEQALPDAQLIAAPGIDPSVIDHLSGQEWQQAVRACKGIMLRSELFAYDAPDTGATPQQLKTQLTPYAVTSNNCVIELLQPKGQNKHAIFTTKKRQSLAYSYERDTDDPRISHDLVIKLDAYGNTLEAAKIVYPRNVADSALPPETQAAQERTLITYTEHRFTNDVITDHTYRLRQPAEEEIFELKGVAKSGDYYMTEDFENILTTAAEVPYHQKGNSPAPGSPEKRLIEHLQILYYKDDLTGALSLGQLESRGLEFESYQLAYTPELLQHIFGSKATDVAMAEGAFTHSQSDTNWWVPSGRNRYLDPGETAAQAADRFFVPTSHIDPFGAVTKLTYLDGLFLFIESTEDALGNTVSVDRFNWRTLMPERLRDPNDNLSEVLTEELGLVKATALLGKGDEADDLDGLDAFTTPAETAQIASFFNAPSSTQLIIEGKVLLGHATTRFVYNLAAYQTSGMPAAVATIKREEHFKQNPDAPIQLSFEYSGGLGQVLMTKDQAEPGPAKQLILHPDDSFTLAEVDTTPELRWIGTGRIVVNNKGKPVKQYEPYFSTTYQFEDHKELVETGVTPLLFYDAPGRLVKTLLPDGTFSRAEYHSWKQAEYDACDTVLESSWHNERINSLIDADLLAQGKDPVREKQAAQASAKHAATPKVQQFDAFKRPIALIEHNKDAALADDFYITQATLDIEGNLLRLTDARGNQSAGHKYDMLGNLVYIRNMDNGQRWNLLDITGAPLRTWDERSHEFRYYYDVLHRPLQVEIHGGDGSAPLANICERTFYGEAEPDAAAKNLRGQAVLRYDTGGLLKTPVYDFNGHVLTSTRRLLSDYKSVANWADANLVSALEPDSYTTTTSYDALGRVRTKTLPDNSVGTTGYNRTGLVQSETLKLPGEAARTLIQSISYNEKSQRTQVTYGNDVTTDFTYDTQTFRLRRLISRRINNDLLQDLHYTYDAIGNVTHLEDKAIPATFFDNQMITGLSTYTYDALYRLVQATGRENDAALAFASRDNWHDVDYTRQLNIGDPMPARPYSEQYQYDRVGNITRLAHQTSGNSWTRNYTYQAVNNRLQTTTVGAQTYVYKHHAAHGFITAMPHLEEMSWSFKEELVKTIRQKAVNGTPETTYYQYDASGERLRKITEHAAGLGATPAQKDQRIYIGSFELYKKHSGASAGLERRTIRIMGQDHCFAMLEARNDVDDGTAAQLLRYQLHNHLESATLELDESASIISYEEYHPFGTTAYKALNAAVKAAAKRYRFTGKERDEETGLYYHGARYLCPWLGRWTSCDSLGLATHSNSYLYASNNPVRLIDDDGQAETDTSNVDRHKLASSNTLLNKHVNAKLKQVRKDMGLKPGMTLTNAQRREFIERVSELGMPRGAGVWSTIKSGVTKNAKYNKSHIEKWSAKHLPTKAAGGKYRGAGLGIGAAWWTGSSAVNPSIIVESNLSTFANSGSNKIPIGTDKLGHFFGQGFEYYEVYEKAAGTEAERNQKAIEFGRKTEAGKFGLGTTGVYSHADLEANWSGFRFYKELYDDPFMTFDIGDYVHEQWNEERNHNYYSKEMLKLVVSNFISRYPASFGAMVKKYMRAWAHHPFFSGNLPLAKRAAREELGRLLQGRRPVTVP